MFVVRAEGLTRGPLGQLPKPRSGGPVVRHIGEALMTILRGGSAKPPPTANGGRRTQDVLKDLTFEIEEGSIVAFPGQDLRAIETLMRILIASLQPTGGRAMIRGTIGGLLSVGENLDMEVTGREAILRERSFMRFFGQEDADPEAFVAEVLEFAGMKEFEDVLVRRYSTGMALRLGLAMVLVARPSTIVLGDIMGVGDLDFHERAKARIRQMADEGTTFMLCGPAFGVRDLADRLIYIERGQISRDIAAGEEIQEEEDTGPVTHNWHVVTERQQGVAVSLVKVSVHPPTARRRTTELRMRWRLKTGAARIWPAVDVVYNNAVVFRSVAPAAIELETPGTVTTSVYLPPSFLAAVPYHVRIICDARYNNRRRLIRLPGAVEGVPAKEVLSAKGRGVPLLHPDLEWSIEPVGDVK